jgi:hypothetical protein
MYFRVATTEKDSHSHQNAGVFQRAYDLYYGGELGADEASRLLSVLRWFERNLSLPDRSKLHRRAIFWFKPDAGKVARRIWDLALAVKEHGPPAEVLKTCRPGYIVYEDAQQVAAIPFRDTFHTRGPRRRPGRRKVTEPGMPRPSPTIPQF